MGAVASLFWLHDERPRDEYAPWVAQDARARCAAWSWARWTSSIAAAPITSPTSRRRSRRIRCASLADEIEAVRATRRRDGRARGHRGDTGATTRRRRGTPSSRGRARWSIGSPTRCTPTGTRRWPTTGRGCARCSRARCSAAPARSRSPGPAAVARGSASERALARSDHRARQGEGRTTCISRGARSCSSRSSSPAACSWASPRTSGGGARLPGARHRGAVGAQRGRARRAPRAPARPRPRDGAPRARPAGDDDRARPAPELRAEHRLGPSRRALPRGPGRSPPRAAQRLLRPQRDRARRSWRCWPTSPRCLSA